MKKLFTFPNVLCSLTLIIIFSVFAANVFATDPPQITKEQKLTLIVAYQRALLSQSAAALATQRAQADAGQFFAACQQLVKEHKQPEGTQCSVDVDAQAVAFVPPQPAPAAPKPEAKK